MVRLHILVVVALCCAACAPSGDHAVGEELHVQTNDVSLRARIVGSEDAATTVITVHGGPGLSLESLEAFDVLATAGTRVVGYDQRGSGQSTVPADGDFSLAAQVADLEALRQSLGATTVQLIGESWGGAVAAAYTATYPERVEALVLLAAMPLDRKEFLAGQDRFQQHLTELQDEGLVPDPLPAGAGGSCIPVLDAMVPAYLGDPQSASDVEFASCTAATSRSTFEAFVADDSVEALGARLRGYTGRALLLMGENDAFGAPWLDRNVALLSGAAVERLVLPDAGHLVVAERPSEVLGAVETFLAGDRTAP